jgi:hypothetical protein
MSAAAGFPGILPPVGPTWTGSLGVQRQLDECGQGLAGMLHAKIAADMRAASWEMKYRRLMARYVAMKGKANRNAELTRLKPLVGRRVAAFERKR